VDDEPEVERLTGLPLVTVWAGGIVLPWWAIIKACQLLS